MRVTGAVTSRGVFVPVSVVRGTTVRPVTAAGDLPTPCGEAACPETRRNRSTSSSHIQPPKQISDCSQLAILVAKSLHRSREQLQERTASLSVSH